MAGPGRIRKIRVTRIRISKDLARLSETAAELFADIANAAISSTGSFTVSLAGGSTPRSLYAILASDHYRGSIDWPSVTFFIGDERYVPDDSPESNYRMVAKTLFRPLEIPDRNVYRWNTTSGDAETGAKLYEKDLRPFVPLDLILLGLGADAHTASLFPNTAALHEQQTPATANWVEKLAEHRLTITFPVINSAATVMVLASGIEKAKAVANVLEGEFRPDEFPAQLIDPTIGDLYWLLDESAANLLERR